MITEYAHYNESQAYILGYEAGLKGLPASCNPFCLARETKLHAAWNLGWDNI